MKQQRNPIWDADPENHTTCDYCPSLIPLFPIIRIGSAVVCRTCFNELRGE